MEQRKRAAATHVGDTSVTLTSNGGSELHGSHVSAAPRWRTDRHNLATRGRMHEYSSAAALGYRGAPPGGVGYCRAAAAAEARAPCRRGAQRHTPSRTQRTCKAVFRDRNPETVPMVMFLGLDRV